MICVEYMDRLAQLLQVERLTEIVDIGANPIDGDPPYKILLNAQLCNVTGFEPQSDALQQLNVQKSTFERYLPYAVGDGQLHQLNVCRYSGMTSLLEPDQNMFKHFIILKPNAEVLERIPIQTQKLDDIDEIQCLDFLKIDIQGAELSVFKSGRQKLKKTVVIQTEISFMTLYKDQPAWGEIDIELRTQGFVPHCFAAVKQWPIAPFAYVDQPNRAVNQLLEADLVYVRDFTRPELMDDEQLKHLALIAHHCYQSYDLTLRCLILLEQRGAVTEHAQQHYIDALNQNV